MIRAAVDRIEGEWLILVPDNGPVFQVPVSVFSGFKDGDIVSISVTRDENGEKEVKKEIDEIRRGLNRVTL